MRETFDASTSQLGVEQKLKDQKLRDIAPWLPNGVRYRTTNSMHRSEAARHTGHRDMRSALNGRHRLESTEVFRCLFLPERLFLPRAITLVSGTNRWARDLR
ncbi:hypothetical protein SAMN06265222_1279 [Neorhodopirellula lusitana]|uniref:Uncharacterized protein n=1 Tax=Neorhodopirellula lusitana TaxID=445327 RepID=A0ABY1QRX7_9BACT|nr:hypothetical protein SAMN06265222_1279 [Neorhodopirellula lusitana]